MTNQEHPLFQELKSMVGKVMGIDHVIDDLAGRLGDLERAYLIDDYAEGKDTGIVNFLLGGNTYRYDHNELSRRTDKSL